MNKNVNIFSVTSVSIKYVNMYICISFQEKAITKLGVAASIKYLDTCKDNLNLT